MKLFLFFLFACLGVGMLATKVRGSRFALALVIFSIMTMAGYFFLDLI